MDHEPRSIPSTLTFCAPRRFSAGAWRASAAGAALAVAPALTAAAGADRASRGVVNPLHHAAKAKRVIFLYQAGGPSHLETFDYKPKLAEMHGKPMPESFTKGQQIAQLQGQQLICFGAAASASRSSASRDRRCANCSRTSAAWPTTSASSARCGPSRSITIPAHTIMNTGSIITGRPSMGSWVLYGLGSGDGEPARLRRADLDRPRRQMQPIAARQWSAGILPSKFQGVKLNSVGDPVLVHRQPARASAPDMQRDSIDAINALNRAADDNARAIPEILTRIAQYEMAFRMQTSVPDLVDMSKEPQSVLDTVRRASRATDRSHRTACWRAGWPNAACGSSSSTTATGTTTRGVKTGMAYKAEEVDQADGGADHRPEAARACSTTRW